MSSTSHQSDRVLNNSLREYKEDEKTPVTAEASLTARVFSAVASVVPTQPVLLTLPEHDVAFAHVIGATLCSAQNLDIVVFTSGLYDRRLVPRVAAAIPFDRILRITGYEQIAIAPDGIPDELSHGTTVTTQIRSTAASRMLFTPLSHYANKSYFPIAKIDVVFVCDAHRVTRDLYQSVLRPLLDKKTVRMIAVRSKPKKGEFKRDEDFQLDVGAQFMHLDFTT